MSRAPIAGAPRVAATPLEQANAAFEADMLRLEDERSHLAQSLRETQDASDEARSLLVNMMQDDASAIDPRSPLALRLGAGLDEQLSLISRAAAGAQEELQGVLADVDRRIAERTEAHRREVERLESTRGEEMPAHAH